jgi:2-hydroxy-6-oxo-6-(2'-aminophenyl)hexa-2,4-dienoate hydrolase
MSRVRFELIPDGVQEKEVSVNGISTQYWEIGDGEPLVFVHGGGPGSDAIANWFSVLPRFAARGFRAIAVNMLGFGIGNFPPPGNAVYPEPAFAYDVDSRCRHLLATIDVLGLDRVCLVGNSMGGSSSLRLCMLAPDRVRRMVLMGSGGLPLNMENLQKAAVNYDYTIEGMRTVVHSLNRGIPLDEETEAAIIRHRHALTLIPENEMARKAMLTAAIDAGSPDYIHLLDRDDIAAVKTETLLIHGRHDDIVPPSVGLELHALLDNSWFVAFPDTGHWTMLQSPDSFVDLCSWFLTTPTLHATSEPPLLQPTAGDRV